MGQMLCKFLEILSENCEIVCGLKGLCKLYACIQVKWEYFLEMVLKIAQVVCAGKATRMLGFSLI